MDRRILFTLSLLVLLGGCGQKSTIKNAVEAERLADKYGDGEHVVTNLTFPLDDSSMAFKTPLPGLGPIAGGIMKFVGDVFAKNTDLGKVQMAYTQPIPEIPTNILNSIRLKRFFFYMKPVEGKRKRSWLARTVLGKDSVTFDFLDKLAVRMTSTRISDPDNYVSRLITNDYDASSVRSLMDVFNKDFKSRSSVFDTEKAKEIVLLKYDNKTKEVDTGSHKYGNIHIMETTKPDETKHFLMDQPSMKGLYKRILILENSLLIELKNDRLADEAFKEVLYDLSNEMDRLEVTYIDTCTDSTCLELNVPDVNLIPIATKGNGLKLDAVIHAGKVPESFKLKGFVEFEVKVISPI